MIDIYKLLIVDDNNIQVQSLLCYLDWEGYGFDKILTASNGQKGLEAFVEFEPDLVITDVDMPLLGGLEMVNKIHERGFNPLIIFMSCFDDSEFIIRAYESDAINYILKPINREQLAEAVEKALFTLKKDNPTNNSEESYYLRTMRENFMYRILYSPGNSIALINEQKKQLGLDKFKGFVATKLEIVEKNTIDICKYVEALQSGVLMGEDVILNFEKENRVSILFMFRNNNQERHSAHVRDKLSECIRVARERFEMVALAVLSDVGGGCLDIPLLVQQASYSADNVLETDEYGIASTQSNNLQQYNVALIRDKLETLAEENKTEDIHAYIDMLVDDCGASDTFSTEMLYASIWVAIQMILTERRIYPESIFGDGTLSMYKSRIFEETDRLKSWAFNMVRALGEYIANHRNDRNGDVIGNIIEYINKNYKTIENVDEIASYCYISSSYARKLFKEAVGKTIFEYLLSVKMDKAKALLRRKDATLYEIASEVGYSSKTNFVLAFTKYTGMSPTDYRKDNKLN